jgi:hypothetical protein
VSTAIVSDKYRREQDALLTDGIIWSMAAELRRAKVSVPGEDDALAWDFILAASTAYKARGGTKAESIGGPARAVRQALVDLQDMEHADTAVERGG